MWQTHALVAARRKVAAEQMARWARVKALWARRLDVAPDGAAINLMSPGLDVPARELSRSEPGRVVAAEIFFAFGLGERYAIMSRGFGRRGLTFVSSLETTFGAFPLAEDVEGFCPELHLYLFLRFEDLVYGHVHIGAVGIVQAAAPCVPEG